MKVRRGAHHWGRALPAPGQEVRPMPPDHVRPCVEAPENAAAITEAAA
ncbi:hypothetical protein LHP98_16955 [Rhodobacter sp. Har01]|nr:hypothetical protein [Rhodobacter sp. Har01]MCB6179812.1 hypothetical protein [Rhodobacter sp. Har01]